MQNTNKHRLLYIQKVLNEQSNEQNPLSSSDLIQLCYDVGIEAERKAIYKDIEALQDFGMDLIFTRTPKQGWFVASRLFEMAELKLLVDAVQASNFVTTSKSKQLIEKIGQLCSQSEQKKLTSQIIYQKNKTDNEQIFYLIDQLNQAIDENKSIQFYYFDYTVHHKKEYRHQKRRYKLIPYAMIWDNQRYYCIGYDEKYGNFAHYRIDKMEKITLSEEVKVKQPFDLQEYISHFFSMFHGATETIALQVDHSLVNVFFDRFGQDLLISDITETTFTVHLSLNVSAPLIGWLFQFQDKVKVLSPDSMVDEIKKTAQAVLSLY